MGDITTPDPSRCPKCGTETYVADSIQGTRHLRGDWDKDDDGNLCFYATDEDLDYDSGGAHLVCDNYKCDYTNKEIDFDWEWA